MPAGYSDKVMDHFAHPRNVGVIENPSGVGKVGNPIWNLLNAATRNNTPSNNRNSRETF